MELKAWAGIAKYMSSFEAGADGLATVPPYYGTDQGRKVVEDKKDLGSLLKNPNRYAVMIAAAVLMVILILAAIVTAIVKLWKKAATKR